MISRIFEKGIETEGAMGVPSWDEGVPSWDEGGQVL